MFEGEGTPADVEKRVHADGPSQIDDTANVRALSDDEVAAFRAEEVEKLGTSENVRAVSDEEKAEFLAEQNAGVAETPVDQAE